MVKKITIAIDAMGGENAPEKTIEGVKLFLKNNQSMIANHYVRLITIQDLLNDPNSRNLRNHRIVYSGIEDIKDDLKNHFRISLLKKDWTKNFKEFEFINQKFI